MEEIRRGESQKREDAGARKRKEVGKYCVFRMFCGSGGSKSRIAKAAGAEPAGQMRDEKLHAVVAQSTFGRKKWQNAPFSAHFWKLRCRKSARRCGEKRVWKSKCTRDTMFGPLLEIEIVNMLKTAHSQTLRLLFDDSMAIRCRKSARRCGAKHIWKSNVSKTQGRKPILMCQMSFCYILLTVRWI